MVEQPQFENHGSLHSIQRLPGDASTRQYFRVKSHSGQFVMMKMEPFAGQRGRTPFLDVQEHLESFGIDVPRVIDIDPGHGFILLEDLGDVTLLRKLQDVGTSDAERRIYQRVIDSLIQLQIHASQKRTGRDLSAFELCFDHDKLMWEVQFNLEHFYHGYLKRILRDVDQKLILTEFSEICTLLANEPRVLSHRDFHSRNIMAVPGSGSDDRLVMIDFQDARMGPAQYDLASLLRDSYYQLEESQISGLLDYYMIQYEAKAGLALDRAHFRFIFDLMSVQRNFKAIGSFSSFMNTRGDPGYLKFIGNTFENIRRILLKYPKYSQLREVLFHYYYF